MRALSQNSFRPLFLPQCDVSKRTKRMHTNAACGKQVRDKPQPARYPKFNLLCMCMGKLIHGFRLKGACAPVTGNVILNLNFRYDSPKSNSSPQLLNFFFSGMNHAQILRLWFPITSPQCVGVGISELTSAAYNATMDGETPCLLCFGSSVSACLH